MAQRVCLESLKIMIYITLFSVLLILFIQSLHRKIPTITLEQLYVPSLNKTTTKTATNTTTIYFDLKLDNKNPVGVYYRPMNLTFSYYFPNKTTTTNVPLCVYTIRGFHQHHHKVKYVRDAVVMGGSMAAHQGGGRVVVMRVDLVGRVKFKSIAQWKRTMKLGVDVEVDKYTGEKVVKGGIHMVRSGAAPVAAVVVWSCPPAVLLLIFSSFFNLMLL